MVVTVPGAADREREVYPLLEETLELDLSGLSEDERLLVVVNHLVCTVGRTLKSGTTVNLEVDDPGVTSTTCSCGRPGCIRRRREAGSFARPCPAHASAETG